MPTILLVDDDKELAGMTKDWLVSQGYRLEVAFDGLQAELFLKQGVFDVIILDWDLPHFTGIELCQRYRNSGGTTPVLMLTGKGSENDKECGFDAGADDYLTKPFSMRELAMRVKALSKRISKTNVDQISVGPLTLELKSHRSFKNGEELGLLPKDFAVLAFLMQHPNEIFSTEILLNRVWSFDSETTANALRTSIKRIRQKVDDSDDESQSIIENIRGVGYRLRRF